MRPPIRDASSATGELSRAEVCRQFLAACTADDGSLPPDVESFVTPFEEPERSELREELQSIQRSHSRQTKRDSGDETREFDPGGRSEFVAAPVGTVDDTPPGAGTIDHPSQEGGTLDHVPSQEPVVEHVTSARKRGRDVPVPASVAGYEILGVLGRGAMGVVYKARQRGLKRLVALKMILSGEHASVLDLNRFQAEANAVAQLQHPGIIQIYEIGEDTGRPFFSLEFVDGNSLHKKIQDTPLSPHKAAELLKQMAEAMQYAHERGVIHRDLKPANVLLTSDGMPKIGDFGLAKQIGADESGLTRTGTVLGTPSYMSPEQAEGRLSEVGPLADVYSLGAILYDMLTGRPPFRGTSVLDTLEQLRTREPVPPMQFQPGVPRDLETICLKCLQKDKTKRYASAGDLAADVGRFLRGEPIVARPVSLAERTWRWCRRNKARTAVIAAFAGVGLFIFVSAWVVTGVLKVQKDAADQAKEVADEKRQLAEHREEEQRKTATVALEGTAEISDGVFDLLQNRRLSIGASPEVKKLRTEALDGLRKQLENIGTRLQSMNSITNADVFNAQLIGDRLLKLGRSQKARETFEIGLKAARAHVEQDPNSDKARANVGILQMRLGDVALVLDGDARTALEHYREMHRLHREIQEHPRNAEFNPLVIKRMLSHDDVHLGQALIALGQAAKAQPYLEEALHYRQEWADAAPGTGEPRSYVMEARMWLGIAGWHAGNAKLALEHSEAGRAAGLALLKDFPKYIPFYAEVAEVQGAHGDMLLRLGKTAEAQRHYREAMAKLKVTLANNPDKIDHQPLLALLHERLGVAATLLNDNAAAQAAFRQARQRRFELWDIDHDNLSGKAALVLALARVGERAQASAFGTKIRPQMAKSTELTLQVARNFAVLAGGDKVRHALAVASVVAGVQSGDQILTAAVLAAGDRANVIASLNALKAATANDYHDAAVLETDPELRALRDEPAFKELVARIKAR